MEVSRSVPPVTCAKSVPYFHKLESSKRAFSENLKFTIGKDDFLRKGWELAVLVCCSI